MSSPRPRAFLVLAPESHGGHLVTDLLVSAGCHGASGDHGPWYPERQELGEGDQKPWDHDLPVDRQPWDERAPSGEDPIVWRRSIPHQRAWSNIDSMVHSLEEAGYEVTAIVVTRDRYAAIQSQLKWRHVPDATTARANISRAWVHIFDHLDRAGCPFLVVSYEALVRHRAAQDRLLEELGLPLDGDRPDVWDGNRKWYAGEVAAERDTTGGPEGSELA